MGLKRSVAPTGALWDYVDRYPGAYAQWYSLRRCLMDGLGLERAGISFLEVGGFGGSAIGFAGIAAAGSIGKFVAHGAMQGFSKLLPPFRRFGRPLRKQHDAKGAPDIGEAESPRGHFGQLCGQSSELDH